MARILNLKKTDEKHREQLRNEIESVTGDLIWMLMSEDPLQIDMNQVDAKVAALRLYLDDYKTLVQS